MRWRGRERSDNVEDRRGISPKAAIGGGGLGVMLIAVIAMFMGADRGDRGPTSRAGAWRRSSPTPATASAGSRR